MKTPDWTEFIKHSNAYTKKRNGEFIALIKFHGEIVAVSDPHAQSQDAYNQVWEEWRNQFQAHEL